MLRPFRARVLPVLRKVVSDQGTLTPEEGHIHLGLMLTRESELAEEDFSAFLRHSQRMPNSSELVREDFDVEVREFRRVRDLVAQLQSPLRRFWAVKEFSLPSAELCKRKVPKDPVKAIRNQARALLKGAVKSYTDCALPKEDDILLKIPSLHKLTHDELLCIFLFLDIPSPLPGDGGEARQRFYMATELSAYFDSMCEDRELTDQLSAEELFCACLDRGIAPEHANWHSLKGYLERSDRLILSLGERRTYSEIAKVVPGVFFPELFRSSPNSSE